MDDIPNHYFVIFGAAVKPDGQPSGTLLRRVQGAWQLGKETDSACFIVTGGVGEHGPAEGLVMQQLLLRMGVRCQRGAMPSDRATLGIRKWLYYYLREAVAIPWSVLRLGYWLLSHMLGAKTGV